MKIILTAFLLLLLPTSSYAMPQIPDSVKYNDLDFPCLGAGCVSISQHRNIELVPLHTICYHGHIASRLISTPIGAGNEIYEINSLPGDLRLAASVAAFGQLLRGMPYTKNFTYDDVIKLAEPARGRDEHGYRAEFANLVRLAKTARALQ